MNERIKELSEQADEFTKQADALLQKETSRGFRLADWQETFREKFAELIIKECVGITDGLSKLYPRTDVGFDVGYTMGTTRATKEILEHFGVEDAPVNDVDRILQTVRTRGVKE